MAGDNEALGNGIIVTAVRAGMPNANNTAPDLNAPYIVEATWSNSPVDVEPEKFRVKGNAGASITFSQLQGEASETWNIACTYEIHKTP